MSEEIQLEAQWISWLKKSEKKFTAKDIQDLVDGIKAFNAGAIDEYLNKHVDAVFSEWLQNHNG